MKRTIMGQRNGSVVKVLTSKPETHVKSPEATWWRKRTDSCELSSDLNTHTAMGRGKIFLTSVKLERG